MKTDLRLSHFEVAAGQSAHVPITVTNTSPVIEGVTAIVDGINPNWVRLERPLLSLFPDATDSVVLVFDIPTHCQAGDYLIDVRIISAVDPEIESVQDFWLTVTPNVSLELDLRPTIVTGGRKGQAQATVRNTSNCPVDVALTAVEPTREVDCTIDVPRLAIPYGGEAVVDIEMRGRRPWFGQPAVRTISVDARADEVNLERLATFRQKPRIPRGLLTAATLAGIVALWAFIFLWVISELRGGAEPSKAVPDTIATGTENIPLVLIAGTTEGTATASTTGDGIPRVTVEAFRVATDPVDPDAPEPADAEPVEHLELVASGATLDDGTYALRTLIPGTYRLRFSAAGYTEVWYPDDVVVGPTDVVRGLDVTLEGARGSVRAQIELPDGVDPSQLTATVTATSGDAAQGFAAAQTAEQCTVGTDGIVTCSGLPTPGEFTITVSGPGFETQRIDVSLDGGTDTVVDTVKLAGEPGSISGGVVDQDGQPLGGVEVTVSSGQFVARVFSQSTDGRFVVDELPTPNDFVVDFSLEGYTGHTVALPLEAGETGSASASLVGGFASISGTVVDQDGTALGGVDVSLTGATTQAQTVTLTDGASGGGAGSFAFRDLDAPGVYAIAFSGPGLQTQTRVVRFDEASEAALGAVTMQTSFGSIEGVVVDPGGTPLGDVTVELTDGVRTRETVTSTNPAGTFGFDDVPPGSHTLVVRTTDNRGRESLWVGQRDVAAGETVTLDRVELPVLAIGRITGTVTDDAGEPLGLVRVTLRGQGLTDETLTLTDGTAIGTYGFEAVDAPGEYLVTFQFANHESVSKTVDLTTSEGGQSAVLDAELAPLPGPVSGSITDSASNPLVNAEVSVSDPTVDPTTTDVTGRYEFALVPAGTHTLTVTYDDDVAGSGTAERTIVVPPGGGDTVDPIALTLEPPANASPATTATGGGSTP